MLLMCVGNVCDGDLKECGLYEFVFCGRLKNVFMLIGFFIIFVCFWVVVCKVINFL